MAGGPTAGSAGSTGLPVPSFAAVLDTSAQEEQVSDIAVDSKGNAIAAGFVNGSLALSTGASPAGVLLWSVTADGETRWVQVFGSHSSKLDDTLWERVAVGSDDSIVVVGEFTGTITIGEQQFTAKDTNNDFFVVKLDNDGVIQWAKAFGGYYAQTARGVAIAPDGTIYLAGYGTTDVDFFGELHAASPSGLTGAYLLQLSAEGELLQQTFEQEPGLRFQGVALQGQTLLVASAGAVKGVEGVALRTYGSDGFHLSFEKFFNHDQTTNELISDGTDGMVLCVSQKAPYDFGGGAHGTASRSDPGSAFVHLAGNGTYLSDATFAPRAYLNRVVRLQGGGYYLAGGIDGVNNDARQFPYLAHVSANGEVSSQGAYKVEGVFYAAAADANGGVYIGGRMHQAGDFGSGPLRGHDAPLLLRIKP